MDIEDDVVFFLEDEDKGAINMLDNTNLLSTGFRDIIVRQKTSKKKEKSYIYHWTSPWKTESIALNLEISERLHCDTTNELVFDSQ